MEKALIYDRFLTETNGHFGLFHELILERVKGNGYEPVSSAQLDLGSYTTIIHLNFNILDRNTLVEWLRILYYRNRSYTFYVHSITRNGLLVYFVLKLLPPSRLIVFTRYTHNWLTLLCSKHEVKYEVFPNATFMEDLSSSVKVRRIPGRIFIWGNTTRKYDRDALQEFVLKYSPQVEIVSTHDFSIPGIEVIDCRNDIDLVTELKKATFYLAVYRDFSYYSRSRNASGVLITNNLFGIKSLVIGGDFGSYKYECENSLGVNFYDDLKSFEESDYFDPI